MGYDWVVPLGAAIADAVIAVIVLWRGARLATGRALVWLCACAALWNLDIFALYYFDDPVSAEWWSRLFRVGVCFGPVALFHFTRLVTQPEEAIWARIDRVGHVLAVAFSVLALLPGTFVSGVAPHRFGYYIVATPLYAPVALCIVLSAVLSIVLMWRRYRHPLSARQREQIKLSLIGGLVFVPFILTNVAAIYSDGVYPLGNVGNVAWIAIIAYAIVRHRFLDLDTVVRTVLSFALAATIVLLPGACAIAALAHWCGVELPAVVGAGAVAIALVGAVVIPVLQRAIETRLHQAIFPHRYDTRLRLRALGADLVHVLDERELVRRLADTLRDVLDVDQCEVFIRDARGVLVRRDPAPEESLDAATTETLDRLAKPASAMEVEDPALGALFGRRGWEVAVPLRVKNRLTGVVGIAPHRDFRTVGREDLALLAGVGSGASVALENARLSRELRRSESALERANRLSSIGTLAAGIAHEIRNPLTAVKTFVELLPQRLDDREFVTSFRELSLGELRRVAELINDLLSFGKSTSVERRPVDLPPALDQVVRLLESTARKRGVALVLHVGPGTSAVWADPDQVRQIVLNLVLNALEASPAGRTVTVAIGHVGPDGVTIEVRDEGDGIPPEALESIFHPFFTTKEQGTGLGLSLVHQMVLEHGGEIMVESAVGQGTTFRVRLPLAEMALRPTGT